MHQASVIARALHSDKIDTDLAMEVLEDDGREIDGLKRDMVKYLNCLWARRRYSEARKEWVVKASLSTLAHAVGRARDKATIEHDIEPILITRGFIDIVPGGRILTPKGMRRLGVSFEDPES
jgi:Holliday junction resolvasome RuvABC ATP-dependent DNA helicase subunit